jgi:hypothetical protein
MRELNKLLDEYGSLCASAENKRRLSLWTRVDEGVRWENQWHGLPAHTGSAVTLAPVTAECLDKIWESLIGLDMGRYFTEPDYYLEYYLRMKINKFRLLKDDTPLTMDIPLVFGVTHEAGILGQKIFVNNGEEPTFSREGIVDENTSLPTTFDFLKNDYLSMVIPFYMKLRELAGDEYHIVFPHWYRGPQGVALYIRGFQEFSLDLYINEGFARRLLRYVTDAAKAFVAWRQEFTGEQIGRGDLFDDDIPMMSPDMYRQYFLEYELEMSEVYGGIYYWHSCGDVTAHVSAIQKLPDIDLMDFGVTMNDKIAGINNLVRNQAIEFRVHAQNHIQQCSEEESKEYVRSLIHGCRDVGLRSYVIRSSGMSVVHGADTDLALLSRWVDLVREVQNEQTDCTDADH